MKKYISYVLSICLLAACDFVNEEGSGSDNAVYMGNSNSSGVISMTVSNEKGEVLLSLLAWRTWQKNLCR